MNTKKINTILYDMVSDELPDLEIRGLQIDSRSVKPGDFFVAMKGLHLDGHEFIEDAIHQGALGVISETPFDCAVPVIVVPHLSERLGIIASRFYDNPSEKMDVIGVTGTNGKTSCTHFIAQALSQAGHPCGVIGTLGSGLWPNLISSGYTTPDAIVCHKSLAEIVNAGAQVVAMEATSHGLEQHRVAGVAFDIAIFTNLSREHLDYHQDMENYAKAKSKLFSWPGLKQAIINIDDLVGESFATAHVNDYPVYTYSITGKTLAGAQSILASKIHLNGRDMSAYVSTPWGEGILKADLLGKFNLSNLLAVLATLCIYGISFDDALKYLKNIRHVPGRMHAFGGGKLPLVVVDFAHTPDALELTLSALREHTRGKLWCVFGCGGDRDAGKRPVMGQIAERLSDQIIITSDNPRSEDPQSIVDQIKNGLICSWAAEIELDRRAAIAHAIDCAQAGDVVLIAGKGHEQFQIIGNERIPLNDLEQVQLQITQKSAREDH